jgi:PAS domain S-box-containing protein
MKTLFEQNQQADILIEMSSDMMCIINFEGTFLHLNAAWEKLGYTLSELKLKNNLDLVHPDDVAGTLEENKKLYLSKGEIVSFENRYLCKNGEYRWFSWNARVKEGHECVYAIAKDITEIKKNELIHNNLTIYQETLLSNAEHLIIATDENGLVRSFNKAAAESLNYTSDEVLGLHPLSLFHDADELSTRMRELSGIAGNNMDTSHDLFKFIASRKEYMGSDVWQYKRKDGSAFFVKLSITPILDMKGINIGLLAVAIDITPQQKIQALAKERELQLLAFIENAPVSMALFDKEMKYIRASNQWLSEYLKDQIQYIGISHFHFYPESHWKKLYTRALNGETIKDNDFCYVKKDGFKEWISWEIKPWLKADESIGGLIITSENITFRKVAHAAVTQKSQMLNGILRNLPVIIYRINPEGVFTQCIGSGLKLLGLEDDEVVGKKAFHIFPDFKIKSEEAEIGNETFLTSGVHKNGEWHYQNYTFPDNVSNCGIIGFAFDITDKVMKERTMEAARARAEKADKYKSRFLANMSHEIRTPLNAIIGFAEVFDRRNLSTEQREYLQNITSSGSMLLKLIGDILDLSKIEEGKLSLDAESFNLKEVLASDLLPYKYNANKKGLNFTLRFDDNLPAYIIGDSSKIKQVIINLIGNALKFTKLGGIAVSMSQVNRDDSKDETTIKFAVSDSGIGIPAEKQKAIFETFTQADASIGKEFGGSGLGLSIVKQLVELMGGQINISSPGNPTDEGGVGSTFWFVLNFKIDKIKNQVSRKPPKEEIVKFEKEPRILVAEDNPMNQALAEVILKRMGCAVTFAENGEEAVELFLNNTYDLVFMDVQMPLMNGYQATELIRNKYRSDTPIIGLTANVYKDDVEKCMQSGMNDYLGKPYNESQMYQIIKKWLFIPANQTNNGKCTNLSFLKRSGDSNPKFINDMILVFLKQNDEFISSVEKALNGRDKEMLKYAAHKVKSCYKMVGITSADELLRKIENDVNQENWNQVDGLFKEVKTLSMRAVKELKEEIS